MPALWPRIGIVKMKSVYRTLRQVAEHLLGTAVYYPGIGDYLLLDFGLRFEATFFLDLHADELPGGVAGPRPDGCAGVRDERVAAENAGRDHIPRLVGEVLLQIDLSQCEVVTIYYGANTAGAEADGIAEALRQQHPHLEVEAIHGGQPHYNYILSVE